MKLHTMSKMRSLPGPRYRRQGDGSGEEFREDYLIPAFDRAMEQNEVLEVDMDGAKYGYPTSFLEEAFGGLARERGTVLIKKWVNVMCSSEPMLVDEIWHYVEYAEEDRTPPFRVNR